jgi:signal transduction histidine kinase
MSGFSIVAAWTVSATGLLVLLGWAFDIAALKSVSPGLPMMKANTAFGFVLMGVGLIVLHSEGAGRSRLLARYCGSATALLGALTLAEYISGLDLRIDDLLFRNPIDAMSVSLGRMSPAAALNFSIVGVTLSLLAGKRSAALRIADALLVFTALIGIIAMAGYLYNVTALYQFRVFSAMAVHTAVLFIALSAALLAAPPTRGLAEFVVGDDLGAQLARRLMPAAVLVPLLVGYLRLIGQRKGYYGTELGLTLFATSNVVIFTAVIFAAALSLRRADLKRRASDAALHAQDMTERMRAEEATRDATERMHAEEVERASAQRLRNITDKLTEGLIISSMAGQLLHLNRAAYEIFNLNEEEWSRRSPDLSTTLELSTLDGCVLSLEAWPLARILAGEHLRDLELCMRRIDIASIPKILSHNGQIVQDGSGGSVAFLSFSDISMRKKAEQTLAKTMVELQRSNSELEQFSYVASHDLQEPLRMVVSYMQLLSERYKGRLDSDADEFIAFAVDGSNRMQQLIRDLLAYSRVGSDKMVLHNVSSELILHNALTNLRAAIEESRAVVTHDSLPALTTDEPQLSQVFQNLVGNAIKYRSAEVPRVHVSATRSGDKEWIFSVRDNGLGIAPEHFEKVFILFQRLHQREEISGTGIGLSICKKVLEGLGGRIWVESQLGRGSTFRFALPEGVTRE